MKADIPYIQGCQKSLKQTAELSEWPEWPVQGYNLKHAICKEMPTRVAGR